MMRRHPWLVFALMLAAVVMAAATPTLSSSIANYLRTSSGTVLSVGAITDTQCLTRSGTTIAGATCGGAPSGAAGGQLGGTYPNPTVVQVAGVTPGAGGLAVLDDASTATVLATVGGQAADADLTTWGTLTPSAYFQTLVDDADAGTARSTLGLGSIATQASSFVSISGGSVTGITDLAVADGGTGASTAAGARDGILWSSAATIACASPCSPGAGIGTVTVSGTVTVNLPALSGYADGQPLTIHCDSASSCPVTLDPSDSGTCDGGGAGTACAAITVPAHGVVGARRLSSSAWGSVQPGAVGATLRIRAYVDGSGNPRAVTQTLNGSTWTNKGSPVAPDTTQDDAAGDIAWSGTGYTGGAVYLSAEDQLSECELAIWTLSGAGNLGVTWTPTNGTQVDIGFSSNQSAEASHLEGGFIGHATTRTTWSFGGGLGASSGGTRHTIAVSDDDAMTSTACTSVAPVYATLAAAASTSPHASSVTCFTSAAVVDEAHAAVGSSLASPAVGLFACRQAITANTVDATDVVATFTFPAGELTP